MLVFHVRRGTLAETRPSVDDEGTLGESHSRTPPSAGE
jgi:hypothetical protein